MAIHPSASRPMRSSTGWGRATAHPDRDRPLHGAREDAGGVDLVVATLERDDVLCPQQTHHLDLLFVATRSVAEVHAEGLVLHLVPTDADAEPKLAARQHVDLGRLLGHEHGLTLREDEHAGDELEVRVRGEESEQHEDFVERCLGVVRAAPVGPGREVGADHVVVGHQEGEAALLGGASEAQR